MSNRGDFTVKLSVITEAIDAISKVQPLYEQAVDNIKAASEPLLDQDNWKGRARQEFKDTYRIVEHYLNDDREEISSIQDILQGFKDIYQAVDTSDAKKIYEAVTK